MATEGAIVECDRKLFNQTKDFSMLRRCPKEKVEIGQKWVAAWVRMVKDVRGGPVVNIGSSGGIRNRSSWMRSSD